MTCDSLPWEAIAQPMLHRLSPRQQRELIGRLQTVSKKMERLSDRVLRLYIRHKLAGMKGKTLNTREKLNRLRQRLAA